jgi:Uma2 family endonuclease
LDAGRATHRFTRAQYDQMIDAGVFGPEDKLELLDGEIIDMAQQKSKHATAVRLTEESLRVVFGKGFDVRVQLPFRLDDRSEPEPDIAVVPGGPRDYRDAHPATALLIVEVADSTLAFDRTRKLAAYARAGIPEYWIVDVANETVEVCRAPWNDSYSERRILRAGDQVMPQGASASVQVVDLLP